MALQTMFTTLLHRDHPAAPSDTPDADARTRFLRLLQTALAEGRLVKLVLGQYHGAEAGLERLLVRPVQLRGQAQLQLLYRHATKDITKNHPPAEALQQLAALIGAGQFHNAHLQTERQEVQFTHKLKGGRDKSLLRVGKLATPAPDNADADASAQDHNRAKQRLLDLGQPYW